MHSMEQGFILTLGPMCAVCKTAGGKEHAAGYTQQRYAQNSTAGTDRLTSGYNRASNLWMEGLNWTTSSFII